MAAMLVICRVHRIEVAADVDAQTIQSLRTEHADCDPDHPEAFDAPIRRGWTHRD